MSIMEPTSLSAPLSLSQFRNSLMSQRRKSQNFLPFTLLKDGINTFAAIIIMIIAIHVIV